MKLRRFFSLFLILALLTAPMAWANYGSCGKCDSGKGHQDWGLDEKFFHKAEFILSNEKAIGLSEDQVQSIETQKLEFKKMLITREAEIEIAALDIKAVAYGYPIDEDALVQAVAQKYKLKQAKGEAAARAYAKLRNTLSAEQNTAMKAVWSGEKTIS